MEIRWSEMALRQLDAILDKVQEDYGERIAYKTYDKIDKKVNDLLLFPESGTPDYKYSSLTTNNQVLIRHLQVFPNVIYYNVDGEIINVMLIAHVKQSPRTVISMIKRYYEHGGE